MEDNFNKEAFDRKYPKKVIENDIIHTHTHTVYFITIIWHRVNLKFTIHSKSISERHRGMKTKSMLNGGCWRHVSRTRRIRNNEKQPQTRACVGCRKRLESRV